MALEEEIQVFRVHLLDLLGPNDVNEGKFAAVYGSTIRGPFPDYESALNAAYTEFGLGPFLIKRIEKSERVLYFSRPLKTGGNA